MATASPSGRHRSLSVGSSSGDDLDPAPDPDSVYSSRRAVEHTVGRRFPVRVIPRADADAAGGGVGAGSNLPAVPMSIGTKKFTATTDVVIADPAGGRAKFRLALPPELSPDARDAPFCLLVEQVELAQFSCSQTDAACVLRMDSAHMRSVPWTRADQEHEEMVSCFLPFGQLSGPSQLRRLHSSRIVTPHVDADREDLQRELRYGQFKCAQELVDTLVFDKESGRYVPPPEGQPEPLAYTLYRTNLDPAAPAPAPDDLLRPRREHFAHMVHVLDTYYFDGPPRRGWLYAHQLTGEVVADRDCKVRLGFSVSVVRLRASTITGTPPATLAAAPSLSASK
jgi:hypothetical protein